MAEKTVKSINLKRIDADIENLRHAEAFSERLSRGVEIITFLLQANDELSWRLVEVKTALIRTKE